MKLGGCTKLENLMLDALSSTFILLAYTPSAIYSESIEPLYVLHSRFPTKKSWVVAYLKIIKKFPSIKKNFILFYLMQLFSADATM